MAFHIPYMCCFLAYGWCTGNLKMTNQDSAGGKNFTTLNCSIIKIIQKVCKGRINEEIAYRRLNIQLQYIITLLVIIIWVVSFSHYFYIKKMYVNCFLYKSCILMFLFHFKFSANKKSMFKVPMKWIFCPLFYSKKLKSMLHWFIIFEFKLCSGAQNNFSIPPKLAKNAIFVFRGLELVTS